MIYLMIGYYIGTVICYGLVLGWLKVTTPLGKKVSKLLPRYRITAYIISLTSVLGVLWVLFEWYTANKRRKIPLTFKMW